MKKMSTEEVRRQWSYSKDPGPDHRTTEQWWQIRDEACAEFDRWLDQVKADVWDEALEYALFGTWTPAYNPYREQEEA